MGGKGVNNKMEDMAQSPVIRKKPEGGMSFPKAMEAIIEGKSVTRLEWNDKKTYCFLSKITNILTLKDEKGLHAWIVSEGDMFPNDWVVVGQ